MGDSLVQFSNRFLIEWASDLSPCMGGSRPLDKYIYWWLASRQETNPVGMQSDGFHPCGFSMCTLHCLSGDPLSVVLLWSPWNPPSLFQCAECLLSFLLAMLSYWNLHQISRGLTYMPPLIWWGPVRRPPFLLECEAHKLPSGGPSLLRQNV